MAVDVGRKHFRNIKDLRSWVEEQAVKVTDRITAYAILDDHYSLNCIGRKRAERLRARLEQDVTPAASSSDALASH